jgi:hypothetical protein
MKNPTWWQTGFVQIISKLSVAAYKQSDENYLMLKPSSYSQNPTERSNRVVPLRRETQ